MRTAFLYLSLFVFLLLSCVSNKNIPSGWRTARDGNEIYYFRPGHPLYLSLEPYKGIPLWSGSIDSDADDVFMQNHLWIQSCAKLVFSEARRKELRGQSLSVTFCHDTTGHISDVRYSMYRAFPVTFEELERLEKELNKIKFGFAESCRINGAYFTESASTISFK